MRMEYRIVVLAVVAVLGCVRVGAVGANANADLSLQPSFDEATALLQLNAEQQTDAQGGSCPSACSSQGLCLGGRCACYQGYSGDDCSGRTCDKDCNGHGACTNGVCECEAGWAGVDCSFRGCKNGCNNNGYCDTNVGKCTCFPGFTGFDCSTLPQSADAIASAPIVQLKRCLADCTAHGVCDDGLCWCNEGWTGADCAQKVCPNQCSGRGVCDPTTGVCKCKRGYWGDDCGGKRCPKNCHGNGECTKLGLCVCKPGFYGRDCNAKNCQNDCSGPKQGLCTWDRENGPKCHCKDGFIGDDCSQIRCPRDCSGNGKCMPGGLCACDAGFFGLDCSPLNCPKSCGVNGLCTVPPGKTRGECLCKAGWIGEVCDIKSVPCPKSCSGHGTCNPDTGVCTCEAGHKLPDCRAIRCRKNCSNHGTCNVNITDGTASCTCDETRKGAYCQELNLEGARQELVRRTDVNRASVAQQTAESPKACPLDCSGHGTCDTKTGVCACKKGHSGADCASKACPNNCNEHGRCLPDPMTGVARCSCDAGWKGKDCNTKTCMECGWSEGRGRCNDATLKCECVEGWIGNHCQRRACANGCSGHGSCYRKRDPATNQPLPDGESECRCLAGWEGKDCSIAKTCPNDCSGKGKCYDGRCLCDAGWHGVDCTMPGARAPAHAVVQVDGKAKTSCDPACGEHGRCLPFSNEKGEEDFVCFCENGWIGTTCAVRDGPQDPQSNMV